jgi:hypothetical protein
MPFPGSIRLSLLRTGAQPRSGSDCGALLLTFIQARLLAKSFTIKRRGVFCSTLSACLVLGADRAHQGGARTARPRSGSRSRGTAVGVRSSRWAGRLPRGLWRCWWGRSRRSIPPVGALAPSCGGRCTQTSLAPLGPEVIVYRTEQSRTFQRRDGSSATRIYSKPVHFRDGRVAGDRHMLVADDPGYVHAMATTATRRS